MRPAQAYPRFLDLLGTRPNASLLDVSCGAGSLLAAARERHLNAVGIDLSHEAVRLARSVALDALIAVASGESLPFQSSTFDYVTCLGSLEHFLDMRRGLKEMIRVAKPTATLCVMVPNDTFIGWTLRGRKGPAIKWRAMPGRRAWLTGPLVEAAWRLLPLRRQYQFVFLLAPRNTDAK